MEEDEKKSNQNSGSPQQPGVLSKTGAKRAASAAIHFCSWCGVRGANMRDAPAEGPKLRFPLGKNEETNECRTWKGKGGEFG